MDIYYKLADFEPRKTGTSLQSKLRERPLFYTAGGLIPWFHPLITGGVKD